MVLVAVVLAMLGSATKLQTKRNIGITGAVIGTATGFDGTGNINIPTLSVNPDYLSKAVPINKGGTGNTTGNASTATKLQTARNIKIQGAVSGNANFDGSTNIIITTTQANIATITGTITTPATNSDVISATITLNYPSGYNKNNCVIMSLMSSNSTISNSMWSTTGGSGTSAEHMKSNHALQASLSDSNIRIELYKVNQAASSIKTNIKLVLMKIA